MLGAPERAVSVGLKYVEPDALPLRRIRKGKDFAYADKNAHAISDEKVRTRLQKLAVPAAWEDVKLARDPKAHIQAVGRDEAGRLQYRYHEKWTEPGHQVKLEKLETFGEKLGTAREWIEGQLRRQTIDEDFALGYALALLDRAGLGVGYPEYSREDGGRGATTLTREDVAIKDGVVRLRFFGKGGKRIQRIVEDSALARALTLLKAQPGQMLFRWKGKEGEEHCLGAEKVNEALKANFGESTSARDFRTFRASSIVAGALQEVDASDMAKRRDALKQSIQESARFLANTPTVARGSYVHPLVQSAVTDEIFDPAPLLTGPVRAGLTRGETALVRLLKREAAG